MVRTCFWGGCGEGVGVVTARRGGGLGTGVRGLRRVPGSPGDVQGKRASSRAVVEGGGGGGCSDGGEERGYPGRRAAHWVWNGGDARVCQKDPEGRILKCGRV